MDRRDFRSTLEIGFNINFEEGRLNWGEIPRGSPNRRYFVNLKDFILARSLSSIFPRYEQIDKGNTEAKRNLITGRYTLRRKDSPEISLTIPLRESRLIDQYLKQAA